MGGFGKKAVAPQSSSIPSALVTIANLDPKVKALSSSKPQPLSSPTQAEVEQGETSRLLKAKRKGRSMTILTSPSGVSEQTTLSTKTLLGA